MHGKKREGRSSQEVDIPTSKHGSHLAFRYWEGNRSNFPLDQNLPGTGNVIMMRCPSFHASRLDLAALWASGDLQASGDLPHELYIVGAVLTSMSKQD